MITERETYGELTQQDLARADHFAFGVDRNFVRGMGVAIVSILANNPDRRFIFHICASSIHSDDVARIKQIAQDWPAIIRIYQIEAGAFASLPTFEHLPVATYYRFILADLLRGMVQTLVYLDADIVCLGKISELKNIDFGNNVVCVVPEEHEIRAKWLGLQQKKYFNAGMLYINIEQWGKGNYSQKSLHCLEQNRDRFTLLDQDALNVVLDGKVKFLDPRWNHFYDMGRQNEEVPADTVFLHYFGAIKPWEAICHHPMQKYYRKYEQLSPWEDVPPMEPITASKMERYARELWHQGSYWQSLGWYGRYAVEKFL